MKKELEVRLDSLDALIENCKAEDISLCCSKGIYNLSCSNDELLKILLRERQIVTSQLATLIKNEKEEILKWKDKIV